MYEGVVAEAERYYREAREFAAQVPPVPTPANYGLVRVHKPRTNREGKRRFVHDVHHPDVLGVKSGQLTDVAVNCMADLVNACGDGTTVMLSSHAYSTPNMPGVVCHACGNCVAKVVLTHCAECGEKLRHGTLTQGYDVDEFTKRYPDIDFTKAKRILVPINVPGHWILGVIDIIREYAVMLDSLPLSTRGAEKFLMVMAELLRRAHDARGVHDLTDYESFDLR
jgi:hypothetical protein